LFLLHYYKVVVVTVAVSLTTEVRYYNFLINILIDLITYLLFTWLLYSYEMQS